VFFVGDGSVERALAGLDVPSEVLARRLDLGPHLVAAIRDATASTGGDLRAAGPLVRERMTVWAEEVARSLVEVVRERTPAAIVTSLFGVEVLHALAPSCPWAVVNSTFYVGPNPPRPLDQDFGPRAIPLIERYASLLESADLVLHATDPVFDLSFDHLPARHRYVGPLGIREPAGERPAYLTAQGDRWALATTSSQLQDDMPLAEAALDTPLANSAASRVSGGPSPPSIRSRRGGP
jgi:hypothetical protein